MTPIARFVRSPSRFRYAVGVVLFLGGLFRLRQYAYNRSLWLDESLLALNIVHRSWATLFGQLDMNQAAPPGFLFIEKLLISTIAPSDIVLRLYPLLCGLGLLVLALWVGRLVTTHTGVVTFLLLLASCEKLIFYSSEAKQYSSDAMFSVVIIGMAIRLGTATGWTTILTVGIAGAVVLWFSQPAVFVMAAAALYLVAVRLDQRKSVLTLVPMFAMWAASFGIVYLFNLSRNVANESLQTFWQAYFMPLPPTSVAGLRWFLYYPFLAFTDPLSLQFPGLGAFLLVAGSIELAQDRRRRLLLILLLGPIVLTLVASGVHRYPFGLRLLLFLIPILAVLIANGISFLWRLERGRGLAVAALALLLMQPMIESSYRFAKPRDVAEIKTVLAGMQSQHRANDHVFVYRRAVPAYRFYADRYGFDESHTYLEGELPAGTARFEGWYDPLPAHERVWVVFTFNDPDRVEPELAEYRRLLEAKAHLVDHFEATSAWAFLYEIDRP